MIRRLRITNFQIHERLDIRMGRRVTSIVGPTDAGKSAIIRALLWVTTNEPEGVDFIREGAEAAKVELWLKSVKVTRLRSKSVNEYRLRRDGKTEVFRAFGRKVPDEIKAVLRVDPINVQQQLEPHYWLSASAAEVSRDLNRIVDLGAIDKSLSVITGKVRAAQWKVKLHQENASRAQETVRSLRWVREARRLLEVVDGITDEIETMEQDAQALSQALEDVEAAQDAVSRAKRTRSAGVRLLKAIDALREHDQQEQALRALIDDVEDATRLAREKRAAAVRLHAELEDQMEGKCPLCGSETTDGLLPSLPATGT